MKYRNQRVGTYASKREATRAGHLRFLRDARVISDLREQVKYTLVPKQEGERAVTYTADFVYVDKDGKTVVEDVKGVKTQQYVIRRKLMLYVHGIRITEV